MDALIALHMRKNGFSKEAIVEAIQHCAPQAQPERAVCDWQRYAERAASFAFGIDGDMRLARSAAYREERQRENAQDTLPQQEPCCQPEKQQQSVPRLRMR